MFALREHFDIVLLDSRAERWHDILMLVRNGFRKQPGKIVAMGHDDVDTSKLRDTIRQIYGA